MTARILITGSRQWSNLEALAEALRNTYVRFKTTGPVTLVHGGAAGADQMAHRLWVEKVSPTSVEVHPAKDFPHPLQRNAHMVDLGADICLGFVTPCRKKKCLDRPFHYSHGTTYTLELARKAGIDTVEVHDPELPPF